MFSVFKRKKKPPQAAVQEQARALVYAEIHRILSSSVSLHAGMDLSRDLGMDSLHIGELSAFVSRYHKTSKPSFRTVGDLLRITEKALLSAPAPAKKISWPKENSRPLPAVCRASTLPEAFFEVCERMGSSVAMGDDFAGIFTYKRFKTSVSVLAEHFKSLPEKRIAVLLPASAMAYIVLFALQRAHKVPVMLNWTLGPRFLEEMMAQSEAEQVITSESFIHRLSSVDFGALVHRWVFLEKIVKDLSWYTKLKGLWGRASFPDCDENAPAVILFTSGTENQPKAVPLSHKNLLAHHRAVAESYPVDQVQVSYNTLPPFHSLGLSVSGISLILLGIKTAFYPNPADGAGVAEGIARWNISHFWTTPTFLKKLFTAASKEQLTSLRVAFCGGEKVMGALREQAMQCNPELEIIEGYGVSECSPAIALGRPHLPPQGVGRIFPGLTVKMIHPETQEVLPKGKEGEICVTGPTVFSGYLKQKTSPFIEFEGKQWFKTGDMGFFDAEGNLHLSGRLKRFAKIAGEMINLAALEEAVTTQFLKTQSVPLPAFVVCCQGEQEGHPRLILFTTTSACLDQSNELLRAAGFSNFVKFSSVQHVSQFPEMGTGKLDYRRLLLNIQ